MMDQGKGLKEGMISSVDGLKNVPVGTSDMGSELLTGHRTRTLSHGFE